MVFPRWGKENMKDKSEEKCKEKKNTTELVGFISQTIISF
jgi:hypothetical protein